MCEVCLRIAKCLLGLLPTRNVNRDQAKQESARAWNGEGTDFRPNVHILFEVDPIVGGIERRSFDLIAK
jgi:hypothetical protein